MAAYQTLTRTALTQPDLPALLTALRSAVAADVSVFSVDPQTYRLKKGSAWTPAEIATAQTAIDSAAARDEAAIEVDQKALQAMALGLWECIPNPTLTKAQLRARILQIWRTL